MIPTIAIGFALLGGLLLWFVIASHGEWWLKLAAIAVTSAFTFAVWNALDSFTGWPTDVRPPARALLLSSEVDEPDAIYLWLVPAEDSGLLGRRSERGEPRAYRLPYSRELHAEVDRATGLAGQGRRVEIRVVSRSRSHGSRQTARASLRVQALPPLAPARKKSS